MYRSEGASDAAGGIEIVEVEAKSGRGVDGLLEQLLDMDRAVRRTVFLDFFQECIRQGMRETVIAADVGLEVMVDCGTLDPVENGIDVRLPLVGGFEIAKRQKLRIRTGHGPLRE